MKKMLLILPKYFSYEKHIKKQLEELNYDVYMIYENIDEYSIRCKYAIKIKKEKQKYFDNYYIKKVSNKKFDVVLAIRASTLSPKVIGIIKNNSPQARFFMYQWDSTKNNPNSLVIAPYFDKICTFDVDDVSKYKWKYRPLFYITSSDRNKKRKIDVSYICSLHSQRLKIYQKLKKYTNINKKIYIYSKFSHFIKEKYLKKNLEFKECNIVDIKFKSLSLSNINKIMGNSNIIVDYTHPGQTGYTMRTCEAIGHRCKLITNNKMIVDADFYNPNNILVYDMDNFYIPNSFLKNEYTELPFNIYKKYSIESWLKEILNYE